MVEHSLASSRFEPLDHDRGKAVVEQLATGLELDGDYAVPTLLPRTEEAALSERPFDLPRPSVAAAGAAFGRRFGRRLVRPLVALDPTPH